MSIAREKSNSIFTNLKEFTKNFLSIFGDEKLDDEDLENINSPESRELQNSLAKIESSSFLDSDLKVKPTSKTVSTSKAKSRPESKTVIQSIDKTIDNQKNISLIDNQNDIDR